MAESRGAFVPQFSTTLGRSGDTPPPSNFLLGDRGVGINDWFSSTGVRQRVPWGGGTWSMSWDASRTSTTNPLANFDPSLESGILLAFSQPLLKDRTVDSARQQHHHQAQPGHVGAAFPGGARPDRCGGQASLLDVQGDPGECDGSAALARAGTGTGASEQGASGRRAGTADRSRAGGSRSRTATRKPDSGQRGCG